MASTIENTRGFWATTFRGPKYEVREGSVGSAGGDSPLPGILPPDRSSAPEVTVEQALSLSAVYRSVSILSTSVSQLEVGVWRGVEELTETRDIGLVAKPDINTNLSNFLKRTTMSLATTGNAYWRVYRETETSPVQNLEVLNPMAINIVYDDNGNKTYEYSGYTKPKTFKSWQVKHLKLMEIWGSEKGLGPIQACRLELSGSLDLRTYGSEVFNEIPTGVLSSKDYLDKNVADEYKARWAETQAKRGVAVLGNGMAYEPVLLSPADAQFLENQSFSITQVGRLFGIPAAYLLAEINGNAMTYQNMESVDTAFVKYTLTEYLREIEEAFSDLLPRGKRARFKLDGFLRPEDKTRAEVNQIYKNMGVLSAEEIRLSEGWGPMPASLKNAVPTAAPGVAQESDTGDNTTE